MVVMHDESEFFKLWADRSTVGEEVEFSWLPRKGEYVVLSAEVTGRVYDVHYTPSGTLVFCWLRGMP